MSKSNVGMIRFKLKDPKAPHLKDLMKILLYLKGLRHDNTFRVCHANLKMSMLGSKILKSHSNSSAVKLNF